MTCIIGYKYNDKVIMASDTEVSDDSSKNKDDIAKIFVNNGIIFGVAGDVVVNNELRWNFEPKYPSKACSDDEFICKYLRNQLKSFFKGCDNCFNKDDEFVGQLLICYNNQMWTISSDFAITKVKGNYTAIGSGSDYALGALYALQNSKIDIYKKIKLAIQSAGTFGTGCNMEVVFYE